MRRNTDYENNYQLFGDPPSTEIIQHPSWCFCEDCGGGSGGKAIVEPEEDWTANAKATVQYVREQIKLMTETVRKANRIPMAKTEKKQTLNGIQRLELKDLTSDKKRLKIEWAGNPQEVGVNADWASDSIKVVSIASGVKRVYTMGENNPLRDCLGEGFGDRNRWVGREIFAWKATEGILEKEFIRFSCIGENGQEIPFDYSMSGNSSTSAGSL